MPELPEVEVVRRGLHEWAVGRSVGAVSVLHRRATRRHTAGPEDFAQRLSGSRITGACRRGKYLWLPLDSGEALLAHLGMSGQLLIQSSSAPSERHLRLRVETSGMAGRELPEGTELRFVDQRTFGHLLVGPLIADGQGGAIPQMIGHIARDPLDPGFDDEAFSAALRRRRTEIKRALLDQSLVSGVGNIYADEALWRARMHWARPTEALTADQVAAVLGAVREVMRDALREGGTTFDGLYVNVNGESGYFARGLRVYGRRDLPCERCATPIRREVFMNRSSFSCPKCQPAALGGGVR